MGEGIGTKSFAAASALVRSASDSYASKYPCAPKPLALHVTAGDLMCLAAGAAKDLLIGEFGVL